MSVSIEYQPQIEWLNTILLDMAEERSVDALMDLIVRRLAEMEEVALARIWLIKPADICPTCSMQAECPDQSFCLHLVASAGESSTDARADWHSLDGRFRRFPLGVRKVGHIGATGEPLEVADIEEDSTWVARPEWAHREQIRGFAGHPLSFRGENLGVLAVFSRAPIGQVGFLRLRVLADHAAAAIANKRAFQEIERLKQRLQAENEYLKEEVLALSSEILGESPAIRNVREQIDIVASTDAPVLIFGESGTGKELVAREIHRRSTRAEESMIKVNCASIPGELFESEFFGHTQGAFTGALKDREGRFDLADRGTLLLDEVGEIPLGLQSKLLRVLEDGQFERVGAQRTRTVDVRLVAATNRELFQAVEEGDFRQDLFYRLNVYPIKVPPLRDRKEDIPLLTEHFVEQGAKRMKCPMPELADHHFRELQHYDWPGNVRELRNLIERALIESRSGSFQLAHPEPTKNLPLAAGENGDRVLPDAELKRLERLNIENALAQCGWKIYGMKGAAALLGIQPTTLASRIQRMGIKKPE